MYSCTQNIRGKGEKVPDSMTLLFQIKEAAYITILIMNLSVRNVQT